MGRWAGHSLPCPVCKERPPFGNTPILLGRAQRFQRTHAATCVGSQRVCGTSARSSAGRQRCSACAVSPTGSRQGRLQRRRGHAGRHRVAAGRVDRPRPRCRGNGQADRLVEPRWRPLGLLVPMPPPRHMLGLLRRQLIRTLLLSGLPTAAPPAASSHPRRRRPMTCGPGRGRPLVREAPRSRF